MLSLYLHIPFCTQKCAYCSFTSFPNIENNLINKYLEQLKKEITFYGEKYKNQELKTLYLGGGTPNIIGIDNTLKIIEEIKKYFNLEFLEELSIELNPYPKNEVLIFVKTLTNKLKDFPRIRFSFGIQSFDDKILTESGRPYNFEQITDFLRQLREIKQENNVFNFDFIAFGKFNITRSGNLQLRDQGKLDFFNKFVNSRFADSFSLYTLELSEGSKRYNSSGLQIEGNNVNTDNDIYEEFTILKNTLLNAGYTRYELSNFSLPGKNSIHNMIYRTMQEYLGLGLASSSFINNTRFTNTKNLDDYLKGKWLDDSKTIKINHEDFLIEKFFLNLRTNIGITDINEFETILVSDYEKKLKNYQNQGFVQYEGSSITDEMKQSKKLRLTDQGMDVFNSIITELLAKI